MTIRVTFLCQGDLFHSVNVLSLPTARQQDSHESCTFRALGKEGGEWDPLNTRRSCSVHEEALPKTDAKQWPPTMLKSSAKKKRLLSMNRSRSAFREEGIISAGIRQRAWKAICWEAATCLASPQCSLPFATVLISVLACFQTTASCWPLLHCSNKAP